MKHVHNLMLALCVCILAGVAVLAEQAAPAKHQSGDVMTELRAVADCTPADEKRVDGCLALLTREMAEPCAATLGGGGGPIDTGYVQEVIMGSVCTFADKQAARSRLRAIVRQRLKTTPKTDQAIIDRLTVILGYTGDKQVVPGLIKILDKSPDGFMRHSAIRALRDFQDRSAIPALRHALSTDTYARIRFGDCLARITVPRKMVYSPVRQAAAEALRFMGQSVPEDAEVVEARYVVPGLEKLLYSQAPEYLFSVFDALGLAACPEAEAALQRFIDAQGANDKSPKASGLAKVAEEAIERSRALRGVK